MYNVCLLYNYWDFEMGKKIDLIGKKFNRLLVLSENEKKNNRVTWNCLCDCGGSVSVIAKDLVSGHTKSCGCLLNERLIERNTTHGQASRGKQSLSYQTWRGMMTRCLSQDSDNYKYYGEKGITVCNEWFDFNNFFQDMGERKKGFEIDRIDNNLGYFKDNCRWVNHQENCNNRSLKIELNGVFKTLSEWAVIYGISQPTLYKRYHYRKMPIEKALGI